MNINGLRADTRCRSTTSWACVCAVVVLGLTVGPAAHAKRPENSRSAASEQAVPARDSAAVTRHGWHLLDPCTPDDCPFALISGEPYEPQPPVVATPAGSTYSVSHGIYGDPDGPGPQQPRCILFFNPTLPGAQDDIIRFDGVPETIRTDLFGTVPTVNEAVVTNSDGTFQLVIDSRSPAGTDLFPDRFVDSQNNPLKDACFTIGLDDPLNWAGADTVLAAFLELRKGGSLVAGPINVTGLTNPWSGFFSVVVQQAAGLEADQVHLEVLISKDVPSPANDRCQDAAPLSNGTIAVSNVGATTDGLEEPTACTFDGYAQIGADIWYDYVSTCNGELSLDMCGSFFDTKVAVYNECGGCPPGGGAVACNDDVDGCGPFGDQSRLLVPVTQGQCYRVRIGGFLGEQGPGTLRVNCLKGACCNEGECTDNLTRPACEAGGGEWFSGTTCEGVSCPAVPPPNDECDNCASLTTDEAYTGTTNGAGGSVQSSCGGGGDAADTWHCWTADCTGVAQFDLCDSAFDTTMAIFDACDGAELACNDDACGLSLRRSNIEMPVVEGTAYYVRVSGFDGAAGDYNLTVHGCQPPRGACCLSTQQCFPSQTEDNCLKFNGTYLGDGTLCGADLNNNLRDDACETCLTVPIVDASPADNTVDARAPHPFESETPNLGIGSPGELGYPAEPIDIKLGASIVGAENCFDVCETIVDAEKGPNGVSSVANLGQGWYRITLDRPITSRGVTTIRYTGDGSFVEYTAHPGNVNADEFADEADVTELVNCCLLGLCEPQWGGYSCDLDHSGAWTPSDILMVIDLLNGAGALPVADGTQLPDNTGDCP